jgi:hypothetical protein
VPANVAYVSDNFDVADPDGAGPQPFQAAGDSGMYANIGASLSMPLDFIPKGYGSWTASVTGKYWFTEEETFPGNPDETFPTASVSVSTTF